MPSIILALLLASLAAARPEHQTSWSTTANLTGVYVSNLGSRMRLTCTGTAGAAHLSGTYFSAVGNAAGTYPLSGYATSCDSSAQGGFVVAWLNQQNGNSHSATSWTFRVDQYGYPPFVLEAYWTMVHETSEADAWSAMNLGFDLFTQQEPTIPE
jgi:hypothetical protein